MKLPQLPGIDINLLKNLVEKIEKGEITGFKTDAKGNILIVFAGNNIIVNPPINEKTRVIPSTDKLNEVKGLKKLEQEEYEKGNFFYSREDNIPFIAETRITPREYKKILDGIAPHIPSKDLGALTYAAMICKHEDNNVLEDEIEKIRRVLYEYYTMPGAESSEEEVGKKRGSTMYNWMRCGDVFIEDVIPHINLCIGLTKNDKKLFDQIFLPYWEGLIEFHPTRIFVSRLMDEEELYGEIYERLIYKEQKQICVYSRSGKNELADKTVKRFTKDHPNYVCDTKKYQLGTSIARTYALALK